MKNLKIDIVVISETKKEGIIGGVCDHFYSGVRKRKVESIVNNSQQVWKVGTYPDGNSMIKMIRIFGIIQI